MSKQQRHLIGVGEKIEKHQRETENKSRENRRMAKNSVAHICYNRGRREKNVLTSATRDFHHKYPHSKSDSLETWPEFVIWFLKKWDVPILSILSWPRMSMMYEFSQNFIEPAEWPTYGKFPFNLITEWKPHEWKPALKSMSATAVQYNSILQWIQTGIEIQIKSTNAKCA